MPPAAPRALQVGADLILFSRWVHPGNFLLLESTQPAPSFFAIWFPVFMVYREGRCILIENQDIIAMPLVLEWHLEVIDSCNQWCNREFPYFVG